MPSERPARYSHRSSLLQEAEKIITVDRNKSYGEPDEDFQRIAAIASAMGFRVLKTVERPDGDTSEFVPLMGSDVARFMMALKLSRLAWNPTHRDSWLDLAGYAACGFETAQLEEDRRDSASVPVLAAAEGQPASVVNVQIREMAEQARRGYPTELEQSGWILTGSGADCSKLCTNGHHTFTGSCGHRIRKRRTDA